MSIVHALVAIADTARIAVPTAFDGVTGRITTERVNARLARWSARIVSGARIDLVVRGREHAETDEPLIVMSNHQSHYDIPILYQAIPGSLRMVAKAELFEVPIFGAAMDAAGFIRVDRSNREQAFASLKQGGEQLRAGARIWIAPEGTRSRTGALGRFKSGGFRLALETGTRILPVTIDGTRHVLPAHGTSVRLGQRVTVTIQPPIDPRPYGMERRRALIADVRRAIAEPLGPSAESDEASGPSSANDQATALIAASAGVGAW